MIETSFEPAVYARMRCTICKTDAVFSGWTKEEAVAHLQHWKHWHISQCQTQQVSKPSDTMQFEAGREAGKTEEREFWMTLIRNNFGDQWHDLWIEKGPSIMMRKIADAIDSIRF